MTTDTDYTGNCPRCGGGRFYLSGFDNPHGGQNVCANCGYIPTETDKLLRDLGFAQGRATYLETEVADLKETVARRNRQIRDLRRQLRK